MMSLQSKLRQLGEAFAAVTPTCYHYWRPVKKVPCIIWAESGEDNSFSADNRKQEQTIIGSVDLYTKTEFDPLLDDVQTALEALGIPWILSSVQYEDETKMIHYTWDWSVTNRG